MIVIGQYVGVWSCGAVNPGPFRGAAWYPAVGSGKCEIFQSGQAELTIASVADFGLTKDAAKGVRLNFASGIAISEPFSIAGQGGAGDEEELQLVVNRKGESIHFVHYWMDKGIIADSGIWTGP